MASPDDRDIPVGWYVAALVAYVAGGFVFKSALLNWLVGPLFLLLVLYAVPTLVRTVARKARAE
jgi:hypothetical protein